MNSLNFKVAPLPILLLFLFAFFMGEVKGEPATLIQSRKQLKIQVCLPAKRVYFDELKIEQLQNHPLFTRYSESQLLLAPHVIRRVAISDDPASIKRYIVGFGDVTRQDGIVSAGSHAFSIKSSTVSDQPVYERTFQNSLEDFIAVNVTVPPEDVGPEGEANFWFKLPRAIPEGSFTVWLKPLSMEPLRTKKSNRQPIWWLLTHGGELPISPVSPNAPKLRIKLLKPTPEINDPSNDYLPALTTARIKLKKEDSGVDFVYEFVEKSDELIPDCGTD